MKMMMILQKSSFIKAHDKKNSHQSILLKHLRNNPSNVGLTIYNRPTARLQLRHHRSVITSLCIILGALHKPHNSLVNAVAPRVQLLHARVRLRRLRFLYEAQRVSGIAPRQARRQSGETGEISLGGDEVSF